MNSAKALRMSCCLAQPMVPTHCDGEPWDNDIISGEEMTPSWLEKVMTPSTGSGDDQVERVVGTTSSLEGTVPVMTSTTVVRVDTIKYTSATDDIVIDLDKELWIKMMG